MSLTFLLVVMEAALGLLFPLLLGNAIDDLMAGTYLGLMLLAGLGIAMVIIGSARRLYDTRVYSSIYRIVAAELVDRERRRQATLSRISARTGLLNEFVEFFENSMPEVVGALISLVGILVILASLSLPVLVGCVLLFLLVVLVYVVSGKLNYRLNAGYNSQLEQQVGAISSPRPDRAATHFGRLMKWNIRLSDLETVNYLVIWLGAIALLVFAPVAVVAGGALKYGVVLAVMMYVFDFIDWLVELPLHVQQVIRLQEISRRLSR